MSITAAVATVVVVVAATVVVLIVVVVKVKFSRYRPHVAQRVDRGIAVLFHDRDTRRG